MGYYIRLLSLSDQLPSFESLRSSVAQFRSLSLTIEEGNPKDWRQLLLAHADDSAIALLERNLVQPGTLGEGEIEEFIEDISDCKPQSAVPWLESYLRKVRCTYAFQIFSGTDKDGGWSAVYAMRDAIRESAGGIIQADGEGFSNEEGLHILWQFSGRATGPWWMAVLREGEWATFQMQLDNREHREAFCRGEIPAGLNVGCPE